MSSYRKAVPRKTPSEWAQMKLDNGYALTREDKILLGIPIGTIQVRIDVGLRDTKAIIDRECGEEK